MTDRYQEIRAALALGPTPGPWVQDGDGVTADDEDVAVAMCCPSDAEAAFIAACDPDTIRALLEERDALAKDAARYAIARRMSPQQWADAWELNHRTGKPFDEIIDDLAPFFDAAVAGRGKDERD